MGARTGTAGLSANVRGPSRRNSPGVETVESPAMRSHHPRSTWRVWTLAVLTFALVALPQVAMAQVSINPTEVPTKSDGGWVYWMAEGAIALGGVGFSLPAPAYLR